MCQDITPRRKGEGMSNELQKERKLLLSVPSTILCKLQGKILLFKTFGGEIEWGKEKKRKQEIGK